MNDSAPENREALCSWAASCLGDGLLSVDEVVSTAYSLVFRIRTATGIYYLKQTPPSLFSESGVLSLLATACDVDTAPKRVAENKGLRCFITRSCGDETLRAFFKGMLDREMLKDGVACYAGIQSATAPHIRAFMDAGVPDWRTAELPRLYSEALDDARFSGYLGLTREESAQLGNKRPVLARLCRELEEYRIPDTLNHSDFQNNNILIDHASGKMAVIDWGETHIGNPLLSRYYCLVSAAHVYQLDKNGDDFEYLARHFLDVPGKDFMHVRAIVSQLYPILHTLAWQQLIHATGHGYPKWKERVRNTLLGFDEAGSKYAFSNFYT